MAITVLNELQQRLHAVAIAGTGVIAEDFRLKKAIAQIEAMTAQSPVFAKIHQTAAPLADAGTPEKEMVLLDAVTLLDAVVCTQGDYKIEGEVQPIALNGAGVLKQCRYRELEPLRTALTTTGSGRYEVISSAFQNREPALSDFRLRRALVAALADSYGDMVTLVSSVIEYLGADMVPALKQGFDPQGKKDMARRVALIRKLAGNRENDFYLDLLETASSEIKQEAIGALAMDNRNIDILLGLAKTEKGNIKKAAMLALSRMDVDQSNRFWLELLKKKHLPSLPYMTRLTDPSIADAAAVVLDEFVHTPCTAVTKEEITAYTNSLNTVSHTIANKSSEKLFSVLVELAKNPPVLPVKLSANQHSPENGECSLAELLSRQIAAGLVYCPTDAVKSMAARLYAQHPDYATAAFTAALLTDNTRAYDDFSPCFEQGKNAGALLDILKNLYYQKKFSNNETSGYMLFNQLQLEPQSWERTQQFVCKTLDIRWFQLLMQEKTGLLKTLLGKGQEKQENLDDLLVRWINPNDAASTGLLRDYFYRRAKLAINEDALKGYKQCGGDDFSGLLIKLVQKRNDAFWIIYGMYRKYPMPLNTALSELRQLQPRDQQTKARLEAWITRLQTGEETLCVPEINEGEE